MSTETKTASEWFKLLAVKIQKKAIYNKLMVGYDTEYKAKHASLILAITNSFSWDKSVEGSAYWAGIVEGLVKGDKSLLRKTMNPRKPKERCKCLDTIRTNIIANENANYVRIDMATICTTVNGKRDKENLTGQRIEIGYNHTKRDGTVQRKERKSFVAHDYCPFCGSKY